jgi:hypothetical protein
VGNADSVPDGIVETGDARYRDFSTLIRVNTRLDAVGRSEDPTDVFTVVLVARSREKTAGHKNFLLLPLSPVAAIVWDTPTIDPEEKQHGDTCQEVSWEKTERESERS